MNGDDGGNRRRKRMKSESVTYNPDKREKDKEEEIRKRAK